MKRASDSVDGEGENVNSKRARIPTDSDENPIDSDRNEASLENRVIESQPDDDDSIPDGTKDLSILFDSERKPNPFNFDLNFPPDFDVADVGCSTSAAQGGTGECEATKLSIGVDSKADASNLIAIDEDEDEGKSPLDILVDTAVNLSTMEDASPSYLRLWGYELERVGSGDEFARRAEPEVPQPEAPPAAEAAAAWRAPRLELAQIDAQFRREDRERNLQRRRRAAEDLARGTVLVRRTSTEASGNSNNQTPPPPSKDAEKLGTSPGPFSEALESVRKRAPEKLIEWKRSEGNERKTVVPSLLNLSLKALAESAEGLVSLECIPGFLCKRLIDILCDNRKMDSDILGLLLETNPDEIRVKNCSWLEDKRFQDLFGRFQMESLMVLQLDLCGQCMLGHAFWDAVQSSNTFSNLAIVSLRGACRLSDDGLKYLIKSAPALRSINVGQCCLLTSDSIIFLADSVGANLRELYIDECLKIDATKILTAFKNLKSLEVLSLAQLQTVTDSFVCEIVAICGRNMKELDLADCLVTDDAFKAIGANCADLRVLNISNVNVTDFVLQYLANGCRSIQKLKFRRNKFSDEAMAAFLECSGESLSELSLNHVDEVGPQTALSLARRLRKLSILDLSWCRKITNEALGLIIDSCSSLKQLKIFGCRQITEATLNGHSNKSIVIIGQDPTLLLEHIDDVLEQHDVYLRHSPLPVVECDN